MTERRDMHEGLDPAAAAALRALREEEAVPDAARERVWARLAAETGAADEVTGPKRQGSWARSSGTWTIVVLAAAALVLLASRVGVIDRLVASRGGEAAPYTEVERAGGGAAVVEAQGPAAGARAVEAAGPEVEARAVEDAAAVVAGPAGDVPQGEAESPEGHVRKDVSGETPVEGRAGRRAGRTTQGGAGEARPAEEEAGALAAEAEALARAQAAIQDGKAAAALDELAAYARRFPRGVLREEHDALRAIALCSVGRSREGRGEAQAFLLARPESALAERVRGACLEP